MDYLTVLGLVLLPGGGTLLGALAAEWIRVSWQTMGAVLHAAAGVAIAVVSVELMPRVIADIQPWLLVVAFIAGAGFSVLLVRGVRHTVGSLGADGSRPWMVYLAIASDLLSDGLMIGVGAAVSSSLGWILGLSQVVANIPGGFASAGNFRHRGVGRALRLAAAGSAFLPVLVGASIGYWILRDQGTEIQNAGLAFVTGLLLLTTIEDLVPEADEPDARRWLTSGAFAAGFAFFALLSLYTGG